ncbi:MAG: post-transcriptional regulator [Traorella sp.]
MNSNLMKQIELAISIKTNQLQRNELKSITSKHVKDTLYGMVWRDQPPQSISKAIDDIFKINANEIVAYLSTQAIIQGGMMSVDDISKLVDNNFKE